MRLYVVKIIPLSPFRDFVKGDNFYGFFMYWLDKLGENIESYKERIVFSDWMPYGYFYKPLLPINYFLNIDDENFNQKRKKLKSIKWIKKEDLLKGDLKNILNYESQDFYEVSIDVNVNLNKLTNKTEKVLFTPFSVKKVEFFYPLWMFIYTDIAIDKLEKIFKFLGEMGIGADSSIGKGRFKIEFVKENLHFDDFSNYYLAISPFFSSKKGYYDVFTRFGKKYSTSKYLKHYVIFKDSGSVIIDKCGIVEGKILENGIKSPSFIQAKSIMIPFNIKEDERC